MASLLLNEYRAWWVGKGTTNTNSCSSYIANRLCTKAKAMSFGCSIRYNSNNPAHNYDSNEIIHTANAYHECNDTCSCKNGYCYREGAGSGSCSCYGYDITNSGCTGNMGCTCWTKCYVGNCGFWCGGCNDGSQIYTSCPSNTGGYSCSNYCPCRGGNATCTCKNGHSWDDPGSTYCTCEGVCDCNGYCDRNCPTHESNAV